MSKEKITLNIPTSWNEVSIGMYKKFTDLQKQDIPTDEKNVKVNTVKMKDSNGGMIELLHYHSHSENNDENIKNKLTPRFLIVV